MKNPFLLALGLSLALADPLPAQLETLSPINQKLVEAVLAGDIPAMSQAVSEGASVNAREEWIMTPLTHAIESHQNAAFRWLLENGADIGYREKNPKAFGSGPASYPLSLAIRVQNDEAFEELLRVGAKPHIEQLDGSDASPASLAIEYADAGVMKRLEEAGLDWTKPVAGESPLRRAILYNNASAVSFLLNGRAAANEPMSNGNFPLADAAVIGSPEIVEALLAKGADPNVVNEGTPIIRHARTLPHTALINAVRRNSLEVVEMLLKAGADPKALDNAAIKWADLLGNEPIYNLLLKSGAEKPSPHAFLDLPQLRGDEEPPVLNEVIFSDWDFLAAVNTSPAQTSNPDAREISVAVISLSDKSADASSLLAGAFSKLPNVKLVERDELRALGREQALQGTFNPMTAARSGALEGADVVVLLTDQEGTLELRAVDASSGLVVFSTLLPTEQITPALLDRVATSTLQSASKLSGEFSKQLLISLPILTASRSTPEVDRFTRQLTSALAMYLGSQPGTYVLDRREMQRLSLEKDLKADVSAFIGSGLLIDGGIDLSPNRADEVKLNLRAKTLDGREQAVIEVNGSLNQPSQLLSEAAKALLDKLGKPAAVDLDRGAEAAAYASQARAAYDSQLWPQAYALAQAAAALGFSDPEFLKFRILTIIRILRSDLQAITEAKYAAMDDEEEREILARCMPLDFLSEAVTPRSTADYLDLAEELLDLASPIVHQTTAPAKSEQNLWEYLPTIFSAATLPLELTITLSDRAEFSAGIQSLRAKLLEQSAIAIARSKEWQLTCTYRELVRQRCRLLCFWVDDESAVIAEILQAIEDAHRLEFPYILHFLMKGVTPENADTPRRIGSRLGTFPERLAKAMVASEWPHARLKGILRMAEWGIGPNGRKYWEDQLPQAYEQVLLFDHTPAGTGHELRFEETPPTLKNSSPDSPKIRTFIEPWYSQPRRMPKSELVRLTTRRLEYLAEHGLGTCLLFIDPKEVDAKTLDRWLQLSETALSKFEAGPNKEVFPSAARYFREFRIDPIKSALALQVAREAPKPASLGPVTGIHPAQLPEFRDRNVQKSGMGLNVVYQRNSLEGVWVAIENGGFLNLSPGTKVLEVVPFPRGHFFGDLLATESRFLAAELDIENSFDDVFAIYDRNKEVWKFFPDALRPRVQIFGDAVVVGMLHHPDPKANSDLTQDERTTYTLELMNPETGERNILVSSRRTPPQSPVDNRPELTRGFGVSKLSEHEFVLMDFVYNLDTKAWRPLVREDRKLLKNVRSTSNVLAPWAGRMYNVTFRKETGQLVINADMSEPTVNANGKPTSQSRKCEILIPPIAIIPQEATARNSPPAPETFRYTIDAQKAMVAWNDDTLAVIPQDLYMPSIHQWLEQNQVLKQNP